MNKIILSGRLTRDIELRHDGKGNSFASSVLAVDNNNINPDTGKREADFIPFAIKGNGAEHLAKSCRKGSRLLIEGHLQIRQYVAIDGAKHWKAEVFTTYYEFLDPKPKTEEPKAI